MPVSKTAALILAGGTNKPDMQAVAGNVTNRALIDLNGRPMLDYVVDALRGGFAADGGGRILVAGDVPTPAGCVAVAGGDSMVDTLLSGASALLADETRLLVVTADIPFLTSEAVRDFLERARALGENVQFVYPVVESACCQERFPEMRRTVLRVSEGTFTGGNLVLLDPTFLKNHESILRSAYARRKSVPQLAQMLGLGLIGRLIVSRIAPSALTIPLLEAAVGRVLGGATARAVVSPFPEVGADVDKPEDVAIARRVLAG